MLHAVEEWWLWGAQASDAEVKLIVEYLAKTLGREESQQWTRSAIESSNLAARRMLSTIKFQYFHSLFLLPHSCLHLNTCIRNYN